MFQPDQWNPGSICPSESNAIGRLRHGVWGPFYEGREPVASMQSWFSASPLPEVRRNVVQTDSSSHPPLPWPRLVRSSRTFEMGPVSRNYVTTLRTTLGRNDQSVLIGLSMLANQGFLTGFSAGRVLNEGPKVSGQPWRNCPSSRHGKASLRQTKTGNKERPLFGCPR